MDRLLKPDKLEASPNDSNARKVFDYWFKTFESFISAVLASSEAPDQVNRLALLTNFLSPETYSYIEMASTYEEAVRFLKKAYQGQKNIVFARYQLMTRKQKENESITEFIHALRLLAKTCEFEAVTAEKYKNEMTRDAFINGLHSCDIRQRLLEEETIDLLAVIRKAETLELAKKNADAYGKLEINQPTISKINLQMSNSKLPNKPSNNDFVNFSGTTHKYKACHFCGGPFHSKGRAACPAVEKNCFNCGKLGHFSKVCRQRPTYVSSLPVPEEQKQNEGNDDKILASAPACLQRTVISCAINNIKLDGLLDSGASENFISEKVVLDIGLRRHGKVSQVSMASSQLNAPVLGSVTTNLIIDGRVYNNLSFGVVPGLCSDIILGQDFMSQHDEIVFKLGGPRKGFILQHCSVAASRMNSPELFRNLEPGCRPITTKSRRFNESDKVFIKDEVSKLLNDGIIEPSFSPWRAQVLVTKDERHKRRMVVDYSQTINRYTLLDAYPLPSIDEQVNAIAQGHVFSTLDLKSAYYQIPLCSADRPFTAFEADGKLYQYTRLPFGITNGVSFFQRLIDEIISKNNLKGTYAYLDNITVSGHDQADHDRKLEQLLNAASQENLSFNETKCIFSQSEIDILGYRVSHLKIKPDPERLRPLIELPQPKTKKELQRIVGMFSYYARWIPGFSEKIKLLVDSIKQNSVPLSDAAVKDFNCLKEDLKSATLTCIKKGVAFTVECDASEHSLAASLNQGGQPVAFHSRTFNPSEKKYSIVEKEATAIMDAVRKWSHYLHGQRFRLITDQRAVSFMFNPQRLGKIKNTKIEIWRSELGNFDYDILHRPGKDNVVPDTLTRISSIVFNGLKLQEIHNHLGHPGVTRLTHFVRTKNLPFSVEDVKNVCRDCKVCAEVKPRFFQKPQERLIKATKPWERLSIDFKGPLQGKNNYMLVVVDEFSRYPFAFPCKDMTASTVIQKLRTLFGLFGLPMFVHSDRGSSFMSRELKDYLTQRGVATSRTTPYHPTGNGQCERTNQTIWRTILLCLRNHNSPSSSWENVLPDALHAVRSLLCTSTNATPHERFLKFERRSMLGQSLPHWLLQPGTVLLRRFNRSKSEPLVDHVELLDANPSFAHVRFPDGKESTVSVSDLAPFPKNTNSVDNHADTDIDNQSSLVPSEPSNSNIRDNYDEATATPPTNQTKDNQSQQTEPPISEHEGSTSQSLRRSSRVSRRPERFDDYVYQ